MTCREHAAGSAATSLAQRLSGLGEVSTLSLFHRLLREAEEDPTPAPPYGEVLADLVSRAANVPRGDSILARLEDARSENHRPAYVLALSRLVPRAQATREALAARHDRIAARLGATRQEVEELAEGFAAEVRRAGRTTPLAAPPEWVATALADDPNLPGDRQALYALWRLESDIEHDRCPECGRFRPQLAAHACPVRAARADLAAVRREMRPSLRRYAEALEDDLDRAGVPALGLPGSGGEWDWFWDLEQEEQRRLRKRWLRPGAPPPDVAGQLVCQSGLVGAADEREAVEWWLDHTRRIDAAITYAAGRMPKSGSVGDVSLRGVIEPFDPESLFGEKDLAIEHIARVRAEMRERCIDEILGTSYGTPPWEMTVEEYEAELDEVCEILVAAEGASDGRRSSPMVSWAVRRLGGLCPPFAEQLLVERFGAPLDELPWVAHDRLGLTPADLHRSIREAAEYVLATA